MTAVDCRARMVCNLGPVISGQLGDDLISEAGVIRTTGTLLLDGLTLPPKGTEVKLAYEQVQSGTITRFPRRLRVIKAVADPYMRQTTVDVGCMLALKENYKDSADAFTARKNPADWWDSGMTVAPTIAAKDVLAYCLDKIGLTLAPGSRQLKFQFLREEIDLSSGYVDMIGALLISETCYGVLDMQERLVVKKIDLNSVGRAPVLKDEDVVDLAMISGSQEPADVVTVSYNAITSGK